MKLCKLSGGTKASHEAGGTVEGSTAESEQDEHQTPLQLY